MLGVALTCAAAESWAADAGTPDLQNEVNELQQEVQELKGELGQIKQQQKVAVPETPPPQTIGQHVGTVEKDLSDLKTDLSTNLGIQVHGLVDTSYNYNTNHPDTNGGSKGGLNCCSSGGSVNQYRAFDVNANGFELEQFNLHIARTDTGGVGFVTDLNFGQVANSIAASTRYSNNSLDSFATSSSFFDPTQAYLTYTVPVGQGINLELGRFVTLLGAEVIPVYNNQNFNESRGLLFTLGEPLTHTGLRAIYAFNSNVSLTLGVNNGWDDIADNNDGASVEGELSLNPTSTTTLVLNGIYGPEQVNEGGTQRWAIDPIATWHTPIQGLQLIGEYLYAEEGGPVSVVPQYSEQGNQFCVSSVNFCSPAPGYTAGPNGTINIPHSVSWTGAAGYVVYDWTSNIEFALRGEWFRDSDGARTGLRQTLGEFTGTINYKVPKVTGLLARFEYRLDQSNEKPFFGPDPIEGPPSTVNLGLPTHTYSGQDTFMADAIYYF
ncbi:MAG TPA: outer membrane beta-barrel protein [Candidatus Binataceae bacterium]|nr:outer membrane beta-barrel protein [Candidatus Binataceae bacterium]